MGLTAEYLFELRGLSLLKLYFCFVCLIRWLVFFFFCLLPPLLPPAASGSYTRRSPRSQFSPACQRLAIWLLDTYCVPSPKRKNGVGSPLWCVRVYFNESWYLLSPKPWSRASLSDIRTGFLESIWPGIAAHYTPHYATHSLAMSFSVCLISNTSYCCKLLHWLL